MSRRLTLLTSVAYALLLVAWVMSSPPFAAPDEAAHYLRAVGIADGALLGRKVPVTVTTSPGEPGWERLQPLWNAHDTRAVLVPPRLSPPGFNCMDGKLDTERSGCEETTYTGDYPPLAYALPAVALGWAHSPAAGDWLGRAASAIPVLAFLVLAVWLLLPLGPWALAGFVVAVTPMVLFIGSVLNPNGLDITASLACACAALRIAAAPDTESRGAWIALVVSGSVALLTWQLGAVFVVANLLVAGVTVPRDRLRALRARRRAIGYALSILAAALAVSLFYGLSSGADHGSFALHPIIGRLHGGIHQLFTGVLPGAVGNFAALTVRLPLAADIVWWAAAAVLAAGALWLGNGRERVAVAVAALAAIAFPVVFFAFVYSQSGFGLQARYVLPLLMLLPLVCGVVLQRNQRLAAQRLAVRVLVVGVAAFQLFAWWFNAHRSAGTHAVWFLAHPAWSPPLGWWPWVVIAVGGAVCLGSVSLTSRPIASPREAP